MKFAFGTTLRSSLPLAALLLAACGGSGGGATPAPAAAAATPIKLAGAIQGPQPTLSGNGMTSVGKVTPFAGAGIAGSFNGQQASVSDGTFLYVAKNFNNINTIEKLELATGITTTLAGGNDCPNNGACVWFADGTGTAARFNYLSAIAIDPAKANLYVSDMYNTSIRQIAIATGVVTTIAGAGNGSWGSADNATGALASFTYPRGIAVDASNLYVADQYNNKVRQISLTAPYAVTTLAGDGGYGFADSALAIPAVTAVVANPAALPPVVGVTGVTAVPAVIGRFAYPLGLTMVGGNLYVADSNNQRIRQVAIAANATTGMPAGAISTIAGSGAYGSLDNTVGTAATLAYPDNITTDGVNNLFITDPASLTIRQIDLTTTAVTTLAGNSAVCCAVLDGIGVAATFGYPMQLSFDAGTLYVGDNADIRAVATATATVSTFYNSSFKDGAATLARFSNLGDVATDGVSLFTADAGNNVIRQTNIATGVTSTLAGTVGVAGFVDATGTAATFNHPIGITTDGTNVFVADANNNTIRQIVISTGVVTTLAGTGAAGVLDATGVLASFNYPTAVTTDGTNVYVADSRNNMIRQIVISTGVVTTLAGNGVYGGTDGAGLTAATFGYPGGITTDGKNLYVMNDRGTSLRQVVIATGVTTTLAGTYGFSGALDGVGAAASFGCGNDVAGITTDGSNLYIADACNGKVRKVVIATGVVSSVTGLVNTSALPAGVVNPLSNWLSGITTDGKSLFVSDSNNMQIQKVQ